MTLAVGYMDILHKLYRINSTKNYSKTSSNSIQKSKNYSNYILRISPNLAKLAVRAGMPQ